MVNRYQSRKLFILHTRAKYLFSKAFNFGLLANLIPVPKTSQVPYGNLFSSNCKELRQPFSTTSIRAGILLFCVVKALPSTFKHLAIILNTLGLLQISPNFCYIRN